MPCNVIELLCRWNTNIKRKHISPRFVNNKFIFIRMAQTSFERNKITFLKQSFIVHTFSLLEYVGSFPIWFTKLQKRVIFPCAFLSYNKKFNSKSTLLFNSAYIINFVFALISIIISNKICSRTHANHGSRVEPHPIRPISNHSLARKYRFWLW